VRVIAGSLKGRRLKTPTWTGLRPTSDKLRETLFNVLAERTAGARVLDVFAGTGALGIEAFSRSARSVTFIEDDRRAQALIAENLSICGAENGCAIIRAKVDRAFKKLLEQSSFEPFDIVLLDPPYVSENRASFDEILTSAGQVLAREGVLVLEHARRQSTPNVVGSLIRSRLVVSGDSALSFYQVGPERAGPGRTVESHAR
jgi:16S rRNA (guanine(966)-N(2))-methyltransferase RsmD